MADERRGTVEDFKLTDGQKDWQGKYKQLAQIRKIIEAEGFSAMGKIKNIQELYKRLMVSLEGHMQSAPLSPIQELPGMNFGEPEERQGPTNEQSNINF